MCFFISNNPSKKDLEKKFDANFVVDNYQTSSFVNGFSHPNIPIIIDENPSEIILGNWGLIPNWSKDKSIQKNTLNARIETVSEKNSFKNSENKRCLILVDGFYEWRWIDEKGKVKEKNLIQIKNEAIFALGGIYNIWQDKITGEELTTFSIVTTEANELMNYIHNTKHRMPIVLNEKIRSKWLNDKNIKDFAFPTYNPDLVNLLL